MVLLAAFSLQELRAPEPIIPPRLLLNPIIRIADIIGFIASMAMFGAIMLVPVFLQLVSGVGAADSGFLLVRLMAGIVIGAYASGQLMRRSGRYRWLIFGGLPLAVVGYLLLATITATTPAPVTALYGLFIGIGACVPTALVAVQNASEARDIGINTALVGFFRSLGGSFGAAILWSILLDQFAGRLATAGFADRDLAAEVLRGGAAAILKLPADAHTIMADALAQSFRIVFIAGAIVVGLGMIAAVFLKDAPLRTTPARTAATAPEAPL